jgi:hypothetical protein
VGKNSQILKRISLYLQIEEPLYQNVRRCKAILAVAGAFVGSWASVAVMGTLKDAFVGKEHALPGLESGLL